MGAPTQVSGMHRDVLGGLHETPQSAPTNAYGQKVMNSGVQFSSFSPSGLSTILGGGFGSRPSSLGSTPAVMPPSARDSAIGALNDALGTAQSGVDSAQAAAGRVSGRITNATADLDAARAAAGSIGSAITNVNNMADALSPFAQQIGGQGNALMSLYDQLITGDASRGGIGADYLNSVRGAADALLKINPDDYVASAVSDAQGQTQNAYEQGARELARRGVNVNSGVYAALQGQRDRALAVLRSSVATAARRQGLQDQIDALTQRAGLFKDVIGTAQSVGQQGTTDLATAAGIVQKQGDMFATAGSLAQQQSNAFANIGGVEINLGQLDLQSEGVVQDAINNVTAMQQAMAQFYKDMMTQTATTDKWGYKDDVTQTTTLK